MEFKAPTLGTAWLCPKLLLWGSGFLCVPVLEAAVAIKIRDWVREREREVFRSEELKLGYFELNSMDRGEFIFS